jgi:flagellar hook-associated protein 3 FlgL
MKISTSYLFDRSVSQMSTVQSDLAHTQAQVSASKQVLNPSDAPDQAAAIQRLKSVLAKQDSYDNTLTTVQARLEGEDTTLKSVSDLLIRAKEIATQSANGTLNTSNRQALAVELKGVRDQMLSLANSKDSNGNYFFSGSRLKQSPFAQDAQGEVTYQGDQTRMQVQVGDQRTIPLNRSGTEAFVGVVRTDATGQKSTREFFGVMDDLIAGVTNSDPKAMTRGVGEMDNLLNGVSLAQANVGTDLNVVDQQKQVISDTNLTLKTTLSNIEDLDMASAITKMNKQMLSLEASQSSFAKISQLNLFNFIK